MFPLLITDISLLSCYANLTSHFY